jgi:general secretion pathway protein C
LGAFLQRLTVEPVVEGEKFVGFRLTQMQEGLVRQGVNVQVGDVVTHVNGRSLEGESDAFEVFQSLETAKEIRLSLLRNGQPHEVVVPIIGEPLAGSTRAGDAGAAG